MKIEERIAKLIVDEISVESIVDVLLPKYEQIASEFKQDPKELYSVLKAQLGSNIKYLMRKLS